MKEVEFRYNLQLDLSEFYAAFENDTTLSPIMQKWRGMRPGHPSSLYEYLIIGIVLQNATVRRSMQMFKALIEKYGKYKQLAVHYIWEDLWWKRKNENIPWLEKLIRV